MRAFKSGYRFFLKEKSQTDQSINSTSLTYITFPSTDYQDLEVVISLNSFFAVFIRGTTMEDLCSYEFG